MIFWFFITLSPISRRLSALRLTGIYSEQKACDVANTRWDTVTKAVVNFTSGRSQFKISGRLETTAALSHIAQETCPNVYEPAGLPTSRPYWIIGGGYGIASFVLDQSIYVVSPKVCGYLARGSEYTFRPHLQSSWTRPQ